MTSPKIYYFVLGNILSQNEDTKVKKVISFLQTKGEKPEKRLKKDRI